MPLGTATPKSTSVNYFYLQEHVDLNACLDAVFGIGYSGTSSSTRDADGQQVWELVLNSEFQTGVTATLGDVLVWDQIRLTVYTLAEFQNRYTPQ